MHPDRVEWLVFPDPNSLAAAAAERWLERLRLQADLLTALPGGRIGRRFLELAATAVHSQRLPLAGARFVFGDERCVPPHDPESNYRLAREAFLDPAGISASQVLRIRGEIDPTLAATEATQAWQAWARGRDPRRPALDVVLLGMGEDGHVASLFPDLPSDRCELPSGYIAVVGPKSPPRRVSLTYRALFDAAEVWVLVSGAGKAPALRQSLTEPNGTPLGRVLAHRSRTTVFTDVPA